jgi:hypothetical protein
MRAIEPPFIGLVAVVMVFSIPIIGIISHYAYEIVKAWLEVGLKRDMIARGFTAPEIIEILAASKDSSATTKLPDVPPAKPVKNPAYSS